MNHIRLLDLGAVSALRSQTVYHAVAHAMSDDTPNIIILVSPASPYVCIGFHQDLEKEVDTSYCKQMGLPVYRREVGGGAVYLDDGQVFIQWIFQPGQLPRNLESRFELYIKPLVETYRTLGVNAYRRPINDLHVDGKKIGGTGAAVMGKAEVVVGSLMFTFDKKTMARVLRVSSEKMRDKVVAGLDQYMVTLAELLPSAPDREEVKALYLRRCAEALDMEIVPGSWTETEEAMAFEWDRRFLSSEWLLQRGGIRPAGVKIHEDVRVVDSAFKAQGGLIRVTARVSSGCIDDITLSGDFTLLPASSLDALEQELRGIRVSRPEITQQVTQVFHSLRTESPGVTPADFVEAILRALEPSPQ